jgi:outer membrane protein assembly factor BamB
MGSGRISVTIPTAVATALALLAACATSRQPPTAPAPAKALPPVSVVWTNRELSPVVPPQAVGSVAISIVTTDDRGLALVALEPATGRALWRQPTTPSFVTAGVAIHFARLPGERIAYLRPSNAGSAYARLVVGAAATGADLFSSPDGAFGSYPLLCGDDADVCVTASGPLGGKRIPHRLALATGRYAPELDGSPVGARHLGYGLLDAGDRPDETFVVVRNGAVAWATPTDVAFPRGFSTDHGWIFRVYRNPRAYVGSIFGPPLETDGDRRVIDLAEGVAMAAIAVETGAVLWRDRGSRFFVPTARTEEEAPPVRLRARGRATFATGAQLSVEDLDVAVEGFDVATGRTTWTAKLGHAASLIGGDVAPPAAGPQNIVVVRPEGPVLLDLATGAVAPPPAGATYWCRTLRRYEHKFGAHRVRPGGRLASICDAAGRPATALPDAAATIATGARVGDMVVIATADGFVGLRVHGTPSRSAAE